jgi:3-oxoacyl-[acyl-carrier protein] reductase
MEVAGKNAIVTGGVRGLGRAIVQALLAKGAAVTVFDTDSHGLAELQRHSASVHCVACDVSNYAQAAAATARYYAEFGAAQVLVNNAGVLHSAPLVSMGPQGVEPHDAASWDRVLACDLSSVFYMTSCVAAQMVAARSPGVIVNISSVCAAGNAGQSAYSAAKAGVNALTATWAKELGPLGIRVAAVAPGFADTDSTKAAVGEAGLREIVGRVPSRRLGRPEEIAEAVLGVISNDFFNGKVLALDGGLTL